MKTKLFVLAMLLLSLFGINQEISAAGNEIPITVTNLDFENPNSIRTLSYSSHKVTLEWEYNDIIRDGDYFDIILDKETTLNSNPLADLSEIVFNGLVIANRTTYKLKDPNHPIASPYTREVIRYIFTSAAEGFQNFQGTITFNNQVKAPGSHIPSNVKDPAGNYLGGHVQTLTYTIGGMDHNVDITHMSQPITNSLMYIINSWFNTKNLETNVYWDPSLEGHLIQGFIHIHNADDYQWGDIETYGQTKDFIISQFMDSNYATFFEPAGIKVNLDRYNTTTEEYETFETHYLSYDEIDYDGLENFSINFSDLGIITSKDNDVRIMIEFYLNHMMGFGYKDPENVYETNMAKLTYTNDQDQVMNYQDGGFWYPISESHSMYAQPLNINTSIKIEKNWVSYDQENQMQDIQFEVYADGVLAPIVPENLILKAGESELTIKGLPYYNQSKTPPTPYVYTVKEIEVENYTSTVSQDNNYFKFTNILDVTQSFTINKVWEGGPSTHPDIDIQLYQDGQPYLDPITLSSGESTYTWNDLPYGDATGHIYQYTADEITILDNYMKSLSPDGKTIYNVFIEDDITEPPIIKNPKPNPEPEVLEPEVSKPDNSNKPTIIPETSKPKIENILPQTGVTPNNMLMPLAFIIAGFALVTYLFKKKN